MIGQVLDKDANVRPFLQFEPFSGVLAYQVVNIFAVDFKIRDANEKSKKK